MKHLTCNFYREEKDVLKLLGADSEMAAKIIEIAEVAEHSDDVRAAIQGDTLQLRRRNTLALEAPEEDEAAYETDLEPESELGCVL